VKKLCTQHKYDLAIGASEIPEACVGNISKARLWVGKLVKELASKLMVQEINSFQINYFSLNLFFPLKDHVTTTTERKKNEQWRQSLCKL